MSTGMTLEVDMSVCPDCFGSGHDGTVNRGDCPVCRGKGDITPTSYTTKTGRVLTDDDIERLAEEAERGYDLPE
jgi:DnaJ-class molecular chaperone